MTELAAPRPSMGFSLRWSAALALFVALVAAPRTTEAQPQQACDAACHNRLGIEAVERADFARAVAEFAEAYRLDPSPRRLNNLARAEVSLGRIDDAITHYTLFLRAPGDAAPDVVAEASRALERLRALPGTLTIDARPAGATVRVDGREVGQAPLASPLTLSVGAHELEVSAPGYLVHQRRLAVTRGAQTLVVELVAMPDVSAAAAPPPAVVARAAVPAAALRLDDDRDRGGGGLIASPLFWGVVGAVVVGVAVTIGIVVASGGEPTTVLQPPTVRAE